MRSQFAKVLVPPAVTPPRGSQWAADAVGAIMWVMSWRAPGTSKLPVLGEPPQATDSTKLPSWRQIA